MTDIKKLKYLQVVRMYFFQFLQQITLLCFVLFSTHENQHNKKAFQ